MIQKKILSPARLQKALALARKKNTSHFNQIVFTNGCFDILHAGHVTYLEKAKKLGHILIVALNTDASTRRLKGPTRPVNPLQDRARVVAALESVDYVTWFDEDTPLKLIQKFNPDILVKGGDYQTKSIVGYEHVTQSGGKVKVLPFLDGRSTTGIIQKVNQKKQRGR
jgi:D-beta-D-heptose 7-phosphate kinase/D-beta-D-heptose 1-phosphate adenosyltransferase